MRTTSALLAGSWSSKKILLPTATIGIAAAALVLPGAAALATPVENEAEPPVSETPLAVADDALPGAEALTDEPSDAGETTSPSAEALTDAAGASAVEGEGGAPAAPGALGPASTGPLPSAPQDGVRSLVRADLEGERRALKEQIDQAAERLKVAKRDLEIWKQKLTKGDKDALDEDNQRTLNHAFDEANAEQLELVEELRRINLWIEDFDEGMRIEDRSAAPTAPDAPEAEAPAMPESEQPSTPLTPSVPAPAEPEAPESEVPAMPLTPSVPVPAEPEAPESAAPAIPLIPSIPGSGSPVMPEPPAKPEPPLAPKGPVAPKPPVQPEGPSKPESPVMPEKPVVPVMPEGPVVPEPKPESPADPGSKAPEAEKPEVPSDKGSADQGSSDKATDQRKSAGEDDARPTGEDRAVPPMNPQAPLSADKAQLAPVASKPSTVARSPQHGGLAVTGTNVDALLMLIGASALAGGGALVARRAARR
ncbi:MAG: hypothetical protein SOX57_09950 [Schaalia hyovaginalis]|uniref:hypothetical protein n=1 Tax=Schaalia hyovaginalis TaxID=29316 RepID=UPI002A7F3D22|nr:hypothetical protein [Schaalia hyovaginalis]MDY4263633.1 hypothetical protein [Schaalia hyovaginalis]